MLLCGLTFCPLVTSSCLIFQAQVEGQDENVQSTRSPRRGKTTRGQIKDLWSMECGGRLKRSSGSWEEEGDEYEQPSCDSISNGDVEIDRHLLEQCSSSAVKRPLSGVCQPCRKAKVRCDRHLPCSRCVRLDLPCRPQCRGKNRLMDGNKGQSPTLQMEIKILVDLSWTFRAWLIWRV